MLDTMRNLSKSLVSKLLMIFLVISFGVWGVGDIVKSGGVQYAVKVGSESVSPREFQQQRQTLALQLEAVGMKDIPAQQLTVSVIQRLVQQKLSLIAMKDMGLVANEALISKMIAHMPEFKNKDGKFDAAKFKAILKSENLSEKAFIAQLKRDVAGRFLNDSLTMQDATAPSSVAILEGMIKGETRDAVLFTIPSRSSVSQADDTALLAYYNEHKALDYLNPESRTLEYVILTPEEIDGFINMAITDEMVNEAAASKPDLAKPLLRMKLKSERRDEILHTLGNAIEDALAAGKTIDEAFNSAGISTIPHVLTNVSNDPAKPNRDDVIKTVIEQGFGLGEGEISRLISSKGGTLLMVSAKKITPAQPKAFEEVKADVKARLAEQLGRDAARVKAISIKETLKKAPNWQAVSEEEKLATRVVSHLARPSQGKSSTEIAPALQQAIFEHGIGEVAGPLTLENGDQMLALVTASHLPTKESAATGANATQATQTLGNDVQNQAFESFSKAHKVQVNPAIMRQQAAE